MPKDAQSVVNQIMKEVEEQVENTNLICDAVTMENQTPYTAEVRDLADKLMRLSYPDVVFWEDLSYDIREKFLAKAAEEMENK